MSKILILIGNSLCFSSVSHEYGHHIFQQHAGPLLEQESRTLRLIVSALNEGFADFIAWLSYGRGDDAYGQAKCGKSWCNRDLASSKHNDNSSKKLSLAMLCNYLVRSGKALQVSEEKPEIDDHALGTTLFHAIDQVLASKYEKKKIKISYF